MTDLRYPIGKFQRPGSLTDEQRSELIHHIEDAPSNLRESVSGLDDAQLDTPYRPDGWTVRQVVHHVPDSHMNAYIRFRLALTEHEPTIKTYDEAAWAALPDARSAPPGPSLDLLESLHERWTMLLWTFDADDFSRTLRHPEMGVVTLDDMLSLYGWHSRHHVAHITSLRARMEW